jgi:hypothetical protein
MAVTTNVVLPLLLFSLGAKGQLMSCLFIVGLASYGELAWSSLENTVKIVCFCLGYHGCDWLQLFKVLPKRQPLVEQSFFDSFVSKLIAGSYGCLSKKHVVPSGNLT